MKYLSSLILLFFSCSTENPKDFSESHVHLKTSNRRIQSNFDACLGSTQHLIKRRFSEKEISEYFSLSTRATGFEFKNVILHLSDTLSRLPESYQIFYDFVYKGDTIGSFRADFDAKAKLTDFRYFHLLAFRKFIDQELTISTDKARQIVINNGMKTEKLDVIFRCSKEYPDTTNNEATIYYWECKNDCDRCLCLDIDAKTGKIIKEGITVFNY